MHKAQIALSIIIILAIANSCKLENKNNHVYTVETIIENKYLIEDYTRNDLITIQSIGNMSGDTCTWKVSKAELEKEDSFSLNELLDKVNISALIKKSISFIENEYGGLYRNDLVFSSFEYDNIESGIIGDNINIKRNDWIMIFNFKKPNDDYLTIREKVFMLPDGKIIISSTNYEKVSEGS